MKPFFARLFSSEVADLESRLAQATRERDWYAGLFDQCKGELISCDKAYSAEITRNRRREDALTDTIRKMAAPSVVRELPKRADDDAAPDLPAGGLIEPALTEADKDALYERAEEYAAQTSPNGATPEQVRLIYTKMLADPGTWLSN